MTMIKNIVKYIIAKFQPPRYKTIYLTELPDKIKKNKIYIIGENSYLWEAAMLCPCGCNEILHMSLHEEGRPKWDVVNLGSRYISLTPSILRKTGCKSHFFFESGFIKWC